jgi:hypothetical protein
MFNNVDDIAGPGFQRVVVPTPEPASHKSDELEGVGLLSDEPVRSEVLTSGDVYVVGVVCTG